MHLVHAKTRSPEASRAHWRLGYFLFLMVGLYFPRSFFRFHTIIDPLEQITHSFAITILSYHKL